MSRQQKADSRQLLVALLAVLLVVLLATSACVPYVPGVLGDVNGDGAANSTDVIILLDADVGNANTARFCPMNCGDVNLDGQVNSTDALILLDYDAGMSVPYPVGMNRCPFWVQQPAACR